MKNFERILLDFYSNTINLIDINTETLLFKNQKNLVQINKTRSWLIEIVLEIQNLNLHQLNNQKQISKFCFFILNENKFGNLVILNEYLSENSLKSIIDRKFSLVDFKERIISDLINSKIDSIVIDLSQSEANQLENIVLDGYVFNRIIDTRLIDSLNSILNIQKLKKIKFENTILNLSDNFINKLTGLDSIMIQSSTITALESIHDLSNLNTIDLCFNKLKRIEFKNLCNLEILKLNGNEIDELNASCFQGLFKLKRLELRQNSIRRVKFGTLNNLTSLVKLDLSRNGEILIEENFKHMTKLKYLNLNGNVMKQVTIKAKNLEFLELGECKDFVLDCNLKVLGLKCEKFPDLNHLFKLNFLHIEGLRSIRKQDFAKLDKLWFLALKFDIDPFVFGLEKDIFFDLPEIKFVKIEFPYSNISNQSYYFECSGEIKTLVENSSIMKILINKVFFFS